MMFIAAMASRNSADTLALMVPPRSCSDWNWPSMVAAPATAAATRITMVECPKAKKKPTETGR